MALIKSAPVGVEPSLPGRSDITNSVALTPSPQQTV